MSNEVILVVEDEADIRRLIEMYLTEHGYRVVLAEDGEQALDMFEREQPDLLVLDVLLTGIDGMEVCRRIRQISHVPILYLTCLDDAEDMIRGLEIGGDDYITKPFNPNVLVARVKANLRRFRYHDRPDNAIANGEADGEDREAPNILTKREIEILALIANGCTNQDIAMKLHLSIGTVKGYNNQIFSKLQVKNRTQAIVRARQLHLLIDDTYPLR